MARCTSQSSREQIRNYRDLQNRLHLFAHCSKEKPPTLSSTLTEPLNSSRLDGALFGPDTPWAGKLFSDRSQYTTRTLTYEQDVLNAFRSILRRSSFITIWGVPVMLKHSNLDPNTGFVLGQLWSRRPSWSIRPHLRTSSTTLSVRRRDFPTWSWITLVAEIFQETYGS